MASETERPDLGASLAELLALGGAALWDYSPAEDRVVFAAGLARLLGVADEASPTDLAQLLAAVVPEDLPELRARARALEASPGGSRAVRHELRIRRPDGEVRWLRITGEVRFDARGAAMRIRGAAHDVSEDVARREAAARALAAERERVAQAQGAERALADSEARFRTVIESVDDGIVLQDATGAIRLWNPAAERILGVSGDQLLGRTSMDPRWRAVREDGSEFPGEEHPLPTALRTGRPVHGLVHGVHRPDGTRVWLSVSATPLFLPGEPRPYAGVAAFSDITAQRELIERARSSEERLAATIQHALDGILSIDEECRITAFNAAAERIFGVPAREAIGTSLDRFIPARHREAHREHVRRFAELGVTQRSSSSLPMLVGLRGDGTEFPIEATISRVVRDGRQTLTVILRDVTERRALEERLRQTQKMEAVAQLAGGIAHDVNNVLAAIYTSAEFLREETGPMDVRAADVQVILDATERARTLTRQLLSFARLEVQQTTEVELDLVIRHAAAIVQRMLRVGQQMVVSTGAAGVIIRADRQELELVLMNLVRNARDAMPGGGTVTISTELVTLDARGTTLVGAGGPGRYARLTVVDTGVGMSDEVRGRVFEPFFTTKQPGQGAGLGLATVYGVVARSRGTITCESAPGAGTRFEVYLPVAGIVASPASRAAASPSALPDWSGHTVMVVDDEPVVRAATARVLQRLGFRAVVASAGEEALRMLASEDPPVDLLLTDFAMPRMTGRELLDRVREQYPALPTILMSGYAADDVTRTTLQHTPTRFLVKPFKMAELVEAIQAILPQ